MFFFRRLFFEVFVVAAAAPVLVEATARVATGVLVPAVVKLVSFIFEVSFNFAGDAFTDVAAAEVLMLTCDAGVVVIIRVVVSAVMLVSLLPAGDGLDVAEIG